LRLTALWWWIDRWRKSTAYTDMTLEEQGAYRNLLDEAHLRGGFLPNDERILAKACGDALAWKRVRRSVLQKFVKTEHGLANETLAAVMSESKRRAKKQADYRARHDNETGNGNGNDIGDALQPPVPVPVLSSAGTDFQANSNVAAAAIRPKNGLSNGHEKPVNGRSRRPIFTGQRFVVFDWMLEDMRRMLGPEQIDRFDVHEWFFDLDARVAKTSVFLSRADLWPWLQTELRNEAIRRGIQIVTSESMPRLGKQTQRLMAAIANAKDTHD
jgi:uncharacterized protein YdaU (DUF1376 family)